MSATGLQAFQANFKTEAAHFVIFSQLQNCRANLFSQPFELSGSSKKDSPTGLGWALRLQVSVAFALGLGPFCGRYCAFCGATVTCSGGMAAGPCCGIVPRM